MAARAVDGGADAGLTHPTDEPVTDSDPALADRWSICTACATEWRLDATLCAGDDRDLGRRQILGRRGRTLSGASRAAVVIGNGGYAEGRLANPTGDADAI